MKKIFLISFLLLFLFSCRSDDSSSNNSNSVSISAIWKPSFYEFKGKTYTVSSCQINGRILINPNMSGVYENYDNSSGNCNFTESYSGNWMYDNVNSKLVISYLENGMTKTKTFNIDSISSTELKIQDNSKNIDGISGNDDAILVYKKN